MKTPHIQTFSKTMSPIIITNISEQTKSTDFIVVRCPICLLDREVLYQSVLANNSSCCSGCGKIKDLRGMSFGRWEVIELDIKSGYPTKWFCKCSCGNRGSVMSKKLIAGLSRSCGCYRSEVISRIMSERVGELHHSYDNTITEKQREKNRNNAKYIKFIKSIHARDRGVCQICGAIGVDLDVHHLYSFAHYPEYSMNPDYAILMCKKDHTRFHAWNGGTKNPCVPVDIDRWLYETC